jgi:hypothetical protein
LGSNRGVSAAAAFAGTAERDGATAPTAHSEASPPRAPTPIATADTELEAVGLRWIETRHFLPSQHFMIFEKPKGA